MSNFSHRFVEPPIASSASGREAGKGGEPIRGGDDFARRHPDAEALGELPANVAAIGLIARLLAARVLREHHLWEAARILPLLVGEDLDIRHSPAFRSLMEAEAFADAVLLLARSCSPDRDLVAVRQASGLYAAGCVCKGRPQRRSTFKASHPDLAAACWSRCFAASAVRIRACGARPGRPARAERPE